MSIKCLIFLSTDIPFKYLCFNGTLVLECHKIFQLPILLYPLYSVYCVPGFAIECQMYCNISDYMLPTENDTCL